MAKTASISLRIEPAVKAQLEALYASFGISVTDAIEYFSPHITNGRRISIST